MSLEKLNELLYETERELADTAKDIIHPCVFIIAPPRSGTTLLYQMLSTRFHFFYPANILARFYKCPAVFLRSINGIDIFNYVSSYTSDLGNTTGASEPHEWGWFWDHYLINNPELLYKELAAIQDALPMTMLFKNINFVYKLNTLKDILGEKMLCIYLDRSPADCVFSIMKAMEQSGGAIGSKHLRNLYIKKENHLECAVLQFLYDTALIKSHRETYGGISIDYSSLCSQAEKEMSRFACEFDRIYGVRPSDKYSLNYTFPETNKRQDYTEKIEACLAKHSHKGPDELQEDLFGVAK